MAHIFGLEHSLGGIAGQIGDFLNPFSVQGGPSNTFGMGGNFPTVVQPTVTAIPAPGVTPAVAAAQGGCAPARQKLGTLYRNPDGSVCVKPYKTRKRKRRLASASDIKDLSALKTVLSPAQVNTWLATRGR